MSETNVVTKDHLYAKARILSEGLRVKGGKVAGYRVMTDPDQADLPKKLDLSDPEKFVKLYADLILLDEQAGGGAARMSATT